MSLLTQASLIMTPNAIKESKVYSIIPSNGNGDLTFTRATTATLTNDAGLIENSPYNLPRLNYDTIGGCPSLLLEPQRTNLITYSQDYTNVIWIKSNSSITANSTTSPNGSQNASRITENSLLGQHYITNNATISSNSSITASVYVKFDSANRRFFLQLTDGTNYAGVVLAQDGSTSALDTGFTNRSFTSTSVGDGWYRLQISITTSTLTNIVVRFALIENINTQNYTGNGTSGLFVWGGQLEAKTYPTTYIPTISSTVTRNADQFLRSNIYTNGLITSAGGAWYLEINNNISLTRDNSGTGLYIGDSATTPSNSFGVINTGSGRLVINKKIAGTLTSLYTTTTNTIKVVFNWNGSTMDVFVNGTKQVTATAFTSTVLEFLSAYLCYVPKYIKGIYLFPSPLTNTECTNLTA